jgi:hypothetical protein
MGIMGIMGIMRNMGKIHKSKNRPAQRDSGISKLGMGLIGLMGPIGLMGKKPVMKNASAQRDSIMSNLKTSPKGQLAVRLVPQSGDPYSPLDFKTTPVQRDSGNSNLGEYFSVCECLQRMFTKFLKISHWVC